VLAATDEPEGVNMSHKQTNEYTGQASTVVAHLNRGWGLTDAQARDRYGIARLAAVVCKLKHAHGLPIRTELVQVPARMGRNANGTATVARYMMPRGAAS
jgi:hypothetical protein